MTTCVSTDRNHFSVIDKVDVRAATAHESLEQKKLQERGPLDASPFILKVGGMKRE